MVKQWQMDINNSINLREKTLQFANHMPNLLMFSLTNVFCYTVEYYGYCKKLPIMGKYGAVRGQWQHRLKMDPFHNDVKK